MRCISPKNYTDMHYIKLKPVKHAATVKHFTIATDGTLVLHLKIGNQLLALSKSKICLNILYIRSCVNIAA